MQYKSGRYYPNQNRLINSTTICRIICYTCRKDRLVHRSRHYISSEQIEWIQAVYSKEYLYQCEDTLHPNNNPRYVKFPNED